MPSLGENARKIAILEAKLEYYEERLMSQIGPPNEEELLRRIEENYPEVDAVSLDGVDPANL